MEPDPLKRNFANFLFLVWQYLRLPDPTPVQYDIAGFIQHGPRRRMVEAFRGVGKSWITVAYVVWRLYCNPQVKVMVVSASKTAADNFTTFCLQLINGMPELAHLIPRANQRDSKIQFDVGPAEPSKDPSVKSVGITGQITGSRADLIVPDDIEVPNNSQTQMMREKIAEAIKEFDSVLKPDGDIVYLGTPQCEQSVYTLLPARGYTIRIWPARFPKTVYPYLAPFLAEALENNPNLVGRPTDPRRFDDKDLTEREASQGRSTFTLQYMLDTSLSDADRYPLKLADLIVMSLDTTLGPEKVAWGSGPELLWNDLPNVGMQGDRLHRPMFVSKEQFIPYQGAVMYVDPSGRGKDETAYAVVKCLHGMLFLTAWGGFLGGYTPETLGALAGVAKAHKVTHVLCEPNYGDGMFTQLLKPVMGRIHPQCAVEDAERSAGQKERRIIDTLEPVLNQHKLIVDRRLIEADFKSTADYPTEVGHRYQGFYQLTRITKDKGSLLHDDRLDALAGAVHYWLEHMERDLDRAVADHRADLLDKELEEFAAHAFGGLSGPRSEPQRTWLSF